MIQDLKIGIVGCGMIGNAKHLPSIRAFKEKYGHIEIVAFCDNFADGKRAEESAKKFGASDARVYVDYKEMLETEDLDIVHVCTTNSLHSKVSIAAMKAGAHVICEKPMARNSEEAEAMLNAARETQKLLTIGFQNRYRSDAQYIKKMQENGDFGEIYVAKARGVRRRNVPVWGQFLNKEEQGGGPLVDIGCHALDLTLWLMDNYEVKSVIGNVYHEIAKQTGTANAHGDWDPANFEVEDSAFGFITMKNGATVTLDCSWALNTLDTGESRCTLYGTKAGCDMRDGLRINGVENNTLYIKSLNLDTDNPGYYSGESVETHQKEVEIFYNAVLGKGDLVVKPEQTLVITKIIDAIYASSQSGEAVLFE